MPVARLSSTSSDQWQLTLLLGLFAALPALAIDINAPSLATLSADLRTSQTVAGLTISIFMAGFAVGQLLGGYCSDQFGRRPALLVGLCCFSLAAAGCAAAQSGFQLLVFRTVQGIAAGNCVVVGSAIIQDLFIGEDARRKRSYVTMVFGLAPVLAPVLGAWLLDLAGWRAPHALLCAGGFVLLLVTAYRLPESLLSHHRRSGWQAVWQLGQVWTDRRLLTISVLNALSYSGLFGLIAGSPLVVIGQMNYSPMTYAGLFILTAGALTCGACVSGRLAWIGLPLPKLLHLCFVSGAVGCFVAIGAVFVFHSPPAYYVPIMMLLFFVRGIIAPNLLHVALGARQVDVGSNAAVVGLIQIAAGAVSSAIVASMVPIYGVGGIIVFTTICYSGAFLMWLTTGSVRA